MTKTHSLLIGKEWKKSSHTIPVVNPFTEEVFAEVCLADSSEIENAIGLSKDAFPKTRVLPSYQRSNICTDIARGIKNRSEEFAVTIAKEAGKPLIYARAEVNRSI